MKTKNNGRITFKAKIFADGEAIDKFDASSFTEFEMKLQKRGLKFK